MLLTPGILVSLLSALAASFDTEPKYDITGIGRCMMQCSQCPFERYHQRNVSWLFYTWTIEFCELKSTSRSVYSPSPWPAGWPLCRSCCSWRACRTCCCTSWPQILCQHVSQFLSLVFLIGCCCSLCPELPAGCSRISSPYGEDAVHCIRWGMGCGDYNAGKRNAFF